MGGADEGFCYAARSREAWLKVPGAIDWLKGQAGIKGIPSAKHHGGSASGGKVGRNELCPCGSGKKYKKCCRVN